MIISIEGNIGSGKSTFLHLLKKACEEMDHVIFIQEPVEKWIQLKDDADGQNILEKFYADQSRWSYSFQMNAFITRAKDLIRANPGQHVIIAERSTLTDRNVFAKLLHESGKITDLEWKLYDEWFLWLNEQFSITPDVFIYLRADYQVSYERMRLRARKEEDVVPIEYLRQVSQKHDEWLSKTSNVMIVNVDRDFEHDLAHQNEIMERVVALIPGSHLV